MLFVYFSKLSDQLVHEVKDTALSKADDRQAFVLPVIGAPVLAAAVPLAAAGAIGAYGAYGDTILTLLNSVIGKRICFSIFC